MKNILKFALCFLAFNAFVLNIANADVRAEETVGQSLSSSMVTAKVKSALISAGLPMTTIKVITDTAAKDTDTYIVTLTGTVKHKKDISRAEDIAASVNGVGHVVNHLKVK